MISEKWGAIAPLFRHPCILDTYQESTIEILKMALLQELKRTQFSQMFVKIMIFSFDPFALVAIRFVYL